MSIKKIIKNAIIQKKAPISFDEFMELVLYHPTLGYYRSGLEKFGAQGDFITAPETSDLFGYCLARQFFQVLNGGDILEFGAGNGILATQILFELGRLGGLPNSYYILELSATLKCKQAQTIKSILPEIMDMVVWLDELPDSFSGVVIANEVLDAIPAKRITYKNNQFYELGVGFQQNKFEWKTFSTPYQRKNLLLPNTVEDGYTTEVNPRAIAWIKSLYQSIDSALVLLIDYGFNNDEYFHPQRVDGTLRCYYQHKANSDPFVNIGKQDITTSVNFSEIANQANSIGFDISGYATQAMFLISLEINEYLFLEQDENKRINLTQQVKQLVLPNVMGESFKVLALTKNIQVKLQGFAEQDLSHKL